MTCLLKSAFLCQNQYFEMILYVKTKKIVKREGLPLSLACGRIPVFGFRNSKLLKWKNLIQVMYFKRVILREESELPWPLKFREEKEDSVPKNGSILSSGGWRKNMQSHFLFQLFFFSLAFFSPGSSSSNTNRVSNKNIAQYFAVLVFNFPARVLCALRALGLLLADGAPIVELGIGEWGRLLAHRPGFFLRKRA